MDVAGDGNENEENAEGAVWNATMANGNQGAHNNMLSSQMAAANGAEAVAEDEEGATGGNENKQVWQFLFRRSIQRCNVLTKHVDFTMNSSRRVICEVQISTEPPYL